MPHRLARSRAPIKAEFLARCGNLSLCMWLSADQAALERRIPGQVSPAGPGMRLSPGVTHRFPPLSDHLRDLRCVPYPAKADLVDAFVFRPKAVRGGI